MIEQAFKKAGVLIEALPYLQRYDERFIVVKIGGSTLSNEELTQSAMVDLTFLAQVGLWPIVVHGGGPRISAAMEKAGLKPNFVQGRRVTDEEVLDIAQRVLIDEISAELSDKITDSGGKAISLNGRGSRFLECEKKIFADNPDLDLGFVGEINKVDTRLAERISAGGVIGVVAPVARDANGHLYNINADSVAWKVAASLKAEKLVFLSDVPGIMKDPSDPKTLLSHLYGRDVKKLIGDDIIKEGMIPKTEACLNALEAGVPKTHIISGSQQHALLLEIFTDEGVGTEIMLAKNKEE